MEKVIAKFKVREVTEFETSYKSTNGEGKIEYNQGVGNRVKFEVVQGGSPENDVFAMHSPYGNVELVIANQQLIGHFKVGSEYYFEIVPVPPTAKV